jgi:uncharacterized phiE125 gp8 family phage protein
VSDLVTLAEQKAFMGVTGSADDALLTALLEHAEALLEAQCGRKNAPFRASQPTITEIHRGTGTGKVWLKYPVNTVASVKIGRDPANPDETLDPADPLVLSIESGKRILERTDDGTFGVYDAPACVRVTYASQDDLPEECKLAVKRVVASVHGARGSEEVFSESDAGYFHQMGQIIRDNPEWQAAVEANKRSTFL